MMDIGGSLLNTLLWEWFRLRRRVGFWVIIALVVLVAVAVLGITLLLQKLPPIAIGIPSYAYPLFVFEVLSRIAPFLSIVLAAMLFGGDFGWGTWRSLLARGQARWHSLMTKLLLGCAILLILWLAVYGAAAAVGLIAGDSGTIDTAILDLSADWASTTGRFFSALPVAIAYLGLGGALCFAGRSTALAVGVGIAIVIIEPIVYPLANTITELALDFSLNPYTRWTLHGVSSGFVGRDENWGVWPFAPALLAYIAALWAVALALLARVDVKD